MTLNTEAKGLVPQKDRIVYTVALTGGPCSGKTTGQARLSTFFENLGWKVFRVPETATVLLGGGVRFLELNEDEAFQFQENLLKTMVAIENTYFALAQSCKRNCLVICDRGTMDASAFISKEAWSKILQRNGWNPVELRDNRYNQVIHLVSAASGAEEFYNCEDNQCRSEDIELARERDKRAAEAKVRAQENTIHCAWVGHPYIDVIDNSTDFDTKLRRLIASICRRLEIDTSDRLATNSHKVKFLIKTAPKDVEFPPFQDFEVIHDYLVTANPNIQSRLRKRGQNGKWSYMYTQRRKGIKNQVVEVKRQLVHRDYMNVLSHQRDDTHFTVYKIRRCFLWENMYFQLDTYKPPCHRRCNGLILLETYTTLQGEELSSCLPPFLNIEREVTGDPSYSMYNLSLKEEWKGNALFNCLMANQQPTA